jgi:hypothetical protein
MSTADTASVTTPSTAAVNTTPIHTADTSATITATLTKADNLENMFVEYYVVVADTGTDYWQLHESMLRLHAAAGLSIDTMGRYYNADKKEIVLPDDDKDEIYAGSYFPRRGADEFLSLEYLQQYYNPTTSKTIALISGIYGNAGAADTSLSAIRRYLPCAFATKAKMYMGCMH